MAVAKAAHEFIIWFKNTENYFNSLIIIMKTWEEDVCVWRGGRAGGTAGEAKAGREGEF